MPSRNASPAAPIRSVNITGAPARRKRRGAQAHRVPDRTHTVGSRWPSPCSADGDGCNSRLNKENDWLTTKANGSATSWLILGSDERDGTTGGSADDTPGFRTDTILMLIKPKSGPSALISIPRDSLVQVNGEYMKINAAAELGGNKALVEAVESISGQKVNHICQNQIRWPAERGERHRRREPVL